MDKIELLSPAGDWERLMMALAYGADAVYLAGSMFGMRSAAGNFNEDEMVHAVTQCHEKGAQVYVTCNTLPRNEEIKTLPAYLEQLAHIGVDAIIAADLGVFTLARKYAPGIPLHVSTQAGVVNYESARSFYDMGASRIVLARELSLDEIAEIRAKTPADLALEGFVHGAMCVSFSGRCLLSSYLAGRDANRGSCAQPCRWKYHLVEEKRPGEYYEISEDGGTHILNARDLCMIRHIPQLIAAGLTSLKIEGRMKSTYYTAVITNAYRHVLDAVLDGEKPDPDWYKEAEKVSHRPYHTGFYLEEPVNGQHYEDSLYQMSYDVVAVVSSCDGYGNALLTQRNRLFAGETLELLMPVGKPVSFTPACLTDETGVTLDGAIHPMMRFLMKLPCYAPEYSIIRKKKQ